MLKIIFLSAAPFGFPVCCSIRGCGCEWLCGAAGVAGCIGVAALSTAVLFAGLAFVHAMTGLAAIRD